jgi:hypothetical protein
VAPEEPAVWLRGTRFDEGQYQRDRLERGLVADQAVVPYSDEPLTNLTNAASDPYKSPSQERLEKARARALEAEEDRVAEARVPDVDPSSPRQSVTPASGPNAKDPGDEGGATEDQGGSSKNPTAAKVAAPEKRLPDPSTAPTAVPNQRSALAGGAIRIQLSSVRTKVDAEREGARLQTLHSEILAGRDVWIEMVDLGAQGNYHRVQFGPFRNFATAEEACRRLKAVRQDCFVLAGRPSGGGG